MTVPLIYDSSKILSSIITHEYEKSTAIYSRESISAFLARSIPHGFLIPMPGLGPVMWSSFITHSCIPSINIYEMPTK